MEWEIPEFIGELELDDERKVLFVEGNADLVLWRALFPELERENFVVYPIRLIKVVSDGGERGRLIKFAGEILQRGLADRVHFFADADFDRILGRQFPKTVSLTDGRDRESYLLLCAGLGEICCHEQEPNKAVQELESFLKRSAGPIAMLRVVSEQFELKLPFQRTLEKGIGRFMDRRTKRLELNKFQEAVFQNGPGISAMRDAQPNIDQAAARLALLPSHDTLHGRDLVLLLAWWKDWDVAAAEQIVSMALRACARDIAVMPSVAGVIRWAKAA